MLAKHPHINLLCLRQSDENVELYIKLAEIMENCPNLNMDICNSLINSMVISDLVDIAKGNRVIYSSNMISTSIPVAILAGGILID
jgi:hypothetical protein